MRHSVDALLSFLEEVNRDFPVPVSDKTEIRALAKKYYDLATLCCEYSGDRILAMVAGYTDHTENQMGYISLVAAVKEARRKGISSRLISEFLEIAQEKN